MSITSEINQVSVEDLNGKLLFKASLKSKNELDKFVSLYSVSKKTFNPLIGLITPMRTDGFKHFVQDLFFPTAYSVAAKVHNLVLKITAVFFACLPDLLLLPLRTLTAPFRTIQKIFWSEKKHKLHALIEKHPDSDNALSRGVVIMKSKHIPASPTDLKECFVNSITINFKKQPFGLYLP